MTSKLKDAAEWLAINGPGQNALLECRSAFQLKAVDTTNVCSMASAIRSHGFSVIGTPPVLIDTPKLGDGNE